MGKLVPVPAVYSTSNTCGSSVASVILQDRETPANLEQVSNFYLANQNMCCNAGTYHGVFSDRITQEYKPTQDSHVYENVFARKNWRLLKNPIGSTFRKRIALHLLAFMKIKVYSRDTYNVKD
jgi:hypothetical protein